MKPIFLRAVLLGCGLVSHLAGAQSATATFPLAGDWNGVMLFQGVTKHLTLHMGSTPQGRMTALLDHVDEKITGDPAIGGSFDGSRLVLRFFYWKPNSSGGLDYKVASFEGTVNASGSEMAGVWTQEGAFPLNFKRLTWQAKVPKPAPPTVFDGDWAGIEDEGAGRSEHFTFHIHNTEDGLMATLDCAEARYKGALASKVSYDQASRQISITVGQAIFTGKMTADGKALDTSMTEPGYHFLIHFDRLQPKNPAPN